MVLIGILISSCRKTPSSNYLPKPLGEKQYAPWDAPVYTYEQMVSFFPTEDYTGLIQIYVSKTGSDVGGDGTFANPYQTIQFAIDAHSNSGTVINVAAGTYNETVIMSVDASFVAPFVLLSVDGPGAAIIDGQMNGDHVVQVRGYYNVLDGFEIKNGGRYCVLVTRNIPDGQNPFGGADSYATIRNNIVHTAVQDVIKVGHLNFVLIEKNDVSGSLSEKQDDQCIDGVGVYHSLCQYNYLHDNGDGGGGYFKGGSTNNIWCFNLIADMDLSGVPEYSAFGIQAGGSGQFSYRDEAWAEYPAGHEQLIHSNIFINCEGCAVTTISAWNTKVYNNTIYNCGYASETDVNRNSIFRAKVSSGNQDNGIRSKELDIRNNISYNDATHPVRYYFSQLNAEYSSIGNGFNCFYSMNGGQGYNFPSGTVASNIFDDPGFLDPVNCDFSLVGSSPCLEAGQNLATVTKGIMTADCMGNFTIVGRPIGLIDMGAYEQ